MKSKSVSVNVTANGLAANNAQKAANQAVEKLNHESSARTAYQIANDETLSELNQAQSDFESNLAWTKSQIEINSHQNDSAVNSLKSGMESTWDSMSSTEQSLYNSASTATSEVDKRLGHSLSDLQSSADSLHARADSLYSDADSTRRSLMTATSELENSLDSVRGSMSVVDVELRNEITSTKSDLASKASSLASATSEVQDDLTKTRTSLAEADTDLKNGLAKANTDITSARNDLASQAASLATASSELGSGMDQAYASLHAADDSLHASADSMKNSLAAETSELSKDRDSLRTATSEVGNSLKNVQSSLTAVDVGLRNDISKANDSITATGNSLANKASSLAAATSEIQKQTGKISGSLSTADSMIMFNSNAIAEVKRTANSIEADLTNTQGDVASVQAQANKLQSQITDTKNNISSVKQTADGLEQMVKKGSRNLIKTAMELKLENGDEKVGDYVVGLVNGSHEEDTQAPLSILPPELNGQKLTVSFDVLTSDTSQLGKMCVNVGLFDGQGNKRAELNNVPFTNITAKQWTRFNTTFNIPQGWASASVVDHTSKEIDSHAGEQITATLGTFFYSVQFKNASSAPYKIKCAQAELGPNATAFIAPDSSISQLIQTSKELKSSIADNSGNISQLRQTANNLQAQITNSQGDISALEQTATEVKQSVKDNQNNISSVSQKADSIKASLTNTQGNVASLQTTANGLASRVSNAEGDISNLQQTASGLQSQATDNGGNISKLQQTAKNLQTQITDNNGNISSLQQTASGLQSSVSDNKKDISSIRQTANSLQSQISSANGDISNLKQTTNSLQSQVTDNKNNISSVKQNATSLQTQITNNKKDISSVKQTASQLSATLSDQAGDLSNLQQKADSLQSQITSANGDISSVKQTANTLRSQITDNKNNISSVKQTAAGLQTQIANNKNDISSVRQTANELSSTVKSGSRNLVKTAMELKLENTDEESNGYVVGLVNAGNGGWHEDDTQAPLSVPVPGLNGQQITVSFDLLTKDTSQLSGMCVNLGLFNGQGTRLTEMDNIPFTGQGVKANEWSRFATTFNVPSDWTSASLVDHTSTAITDHSGTVISTELGSLYYSIQFKNKSSIGYKVKRVQAEFGPNATAFVAPEFSISQLIQTSKELKSLISDNDGDISQLRQAANLLQMQVADNRGNISSLNQTAGEIKQSVKDNQNNISNVSQKADSINASLTNTQGDVTALQTTAKGLTSRVSNAEGNISNLQHTANGLSDDVRDAKGNISSLQQTAKGYGTRIADAESNVSTLQQTATDLKSSIADNKNNISSVKLTATSLQTQLSNANGDISGLKHTATDLQSQVTDNKNNISSVKETATQLSSDMKDAKNNISSLQQTATGLSTTVKSGSRNLIKTAMELKLENTDETVDDYVVGLVNPGYGNWHEDDTQAPLSVSVPDLNGQKLTVGFDLLVNDTAQLGGMYANLGLFNGQGTRITELTNASFAGRGAVAKQWKRISMAFDVPEDWTSPKITTHSGVEIADHTGETISATLGSLYYGVQFKNTSSIGYKIKRAQAEIGPNATAFVAPDFSISKLIQTSKELSSQIADSDGDISQLRQMANLLQMQVADNRGNISDVEQTADGLNATVRNQAGSVSQLQDKADSLQSQITDTNGNVSKITETANGLQTQVKDAKKNISNLQQTATQLNSDMKDAKNNISSLQQTSTSFGTRLTNAEGNVSSLQQTAGRLQTQITDNKNHASTIEETAKGISTRVSGIENNKVVGSLLKLTDTEAGLGSYVNGKLIAGINTNANGEVMIDGDVVHIHGSTHIDNGAINAEKITVHNQMDNGQEQNLAVAWGKLSSIIGGKNDKGDTLWGAVNQTKDKFSSYYTQSDIDSKSDALQRSLISQTSKNITLAVDEAKNFATFALSASNTWDFNSTKSPYGNWFLNGEKNNSHVWNGPPITPYMYVTSRGPKDGSRVTVTAWKDTDPTQYQRVWDGNSWTKWVQLPNTSNLITAINMSPDGVKISGKNIELDGNTKVVGGFNLVPADSTAQDQRNKNIYRPWVWKNGAIKIQNGVIQTTATDATPGTWYDGTNSNSRYVIGTVAPMYIKYTLWDSPSMSKEFARTYVGAERIETPLLAVTNAGTPENLEQGALYVGNFEFINSKIKSKSDSLYISNINGTNFDSSGYVGFQVWSGIGLGQSTIYTPGTDLYVQQGNVSPTGIKQNYSNAPKTLIHCDHVASQSANTVSSRLSLKTDITPVTYDRALAAVEGTEMYDYRYTSDDSGQHYVSGIIDDINQEPQYHMDDMLINKERTARIDSNLVGYHHVVLQELIKKIDKLQTELTELKSKEK